MSKAVLCNEKKVYVLDTDKTYIITCDDGLDRRASEFTIVQCFEGGLESNTEFTANCEDGEDQIIKDESDLYYELDEIFGKLAEAGEVAV